MRLGKETMTQIWDRGEERASQGVALKLTSDEDKLLQALQAGKRREKNETQGLCWVKKSVNLFVNCCNLVPSKR